MKRASGVLLPVSSLPSAYGIGSFSKEAYEWIDCLKKAGQSYWQILPLTPTGFGDSPYQSYSSFAGNPYFIDLEQLISEGLLKKEECDKVDFGKNSTYVDYEKMMENRLTLLRLAFERVNLENDSEYKKFLEDNRTWIHDYAMYMGIKKRFDDASWMEWAEDIRKRWDYSMDYYNKECKEEIDFYKYIQYLFMKQWMRLKKYANDNGIEIIGDLPIYVSGDSSDAWANPGLFQLDGDFMPKAVAGCPPDDFAEDGQLWGNPLYDWNYHRQTGFKWWISRLEHCFKLYDVVRIDHFRGFDEYYTVPYGEKTARNGHWEKGPGIEFFHKVKECLGEKQIIAEDLGFMTDSVKQLLKESGFPGMKILLFAFDPNGKSDYLPHNFDRNTVVYTGTHDNETLVQWMSGMDEETSLFAKEYLGNTNFAKEEQHWDYIRLAMMSSSNTCIIPAQDLLGLGKEARMNFPSTVGDNWKWRIDKKLLPEAIADKFYKLAKISDRLSYECQHLEWVKRQKNETVSPKTELLQKDKENLKIGIKEETK